MKFHQHLAVSLIVSGGFWMLTRSVSGALACFFTGVFIDLDHLLDYLLNFGPRIRPRHFFRAFEFEALENIFLFFHSWEWILAALAVLWLIDWPPVALGLVVGLAVHLAMDQVYNDHHPWAYFISYRIRHRFSAKRFYGAREYRQRMKFNRKNRTAPPA